MTCTRKPMGITLGDPSGIGPEIIAAALAKQPDGERCVVFGCSKVMARAVEVTGLDTRIRPITSVDDAEADLALMNVFETARFQDLPPFGVVAAESGHAAYEAIVRSIQCALDGQINGIVTAPIHKEALSAAGVPYPGHTEMLADFGGAASTAMMLANDHLRVVLVTIHCALREAIDRITIETEMSAIRLAHVGVRSFGIATPRVAVAGLNPHAGEGGLFGREEEATRSARPATR